MITPGQIVRIKCVNVLTYSSIEIFPCPQLNLIIGANGSGKSTIISAIILGMYVFFLTLPPAIILSNYQFCSGLGGNTQIVGRASELSKFVKVGRDNAVIEIELFNPDGANDVVRREFDMRNHSRFSLNGLVVPLEKVSKLVEKKYRIQINNLCQILPQEKLESFAKMNDQQRLEGTLKTVGEADLSKFFVELKESKNKVQTVRKKIDDLKLELQDASAKRDSMESEARMIREKQFLIECLKLLKQRRAWQFYFHIKQTIAVVDGVLADQQKVHKSLVDILKRTLASVDGTNAGVAAQDKISKRMNEELVACVQALRKKQNLIAANTDEIGEVKMNLENKVKRHRSQAANVLELKAAIEKLRAEIARCAQLDGDIDKARKETLEAQTVVGKLGQEKDVLRCEMSRKTAELNAATFRLSKLTDSRELKMQLLERYYPDCWKGLKWLDQNRHLFVGEVYGPMFLYVNVVRADYAKYAESSIHQRDLTAFICERREDTNTLLKECREKLDLRISVVSAVRISDEDELRPFMSIDELRRYGFHSFVSELIDGPRIIVEYLICTHRLNTIPIGNDRTFGMSEQIPREIRQYYTDKYRITKSVASISGEMIESSNNVREARLLQVNQSTGDYAELQAEKAGLELQLREIEDEYNRLQERLADGETRFKDCKHKLQILVNSKGNQKRLENSLRDKQHELHRVENDVVDVAVEKRKCKMQVKLMLAKVSNLYLELGREFRKLFELFVGYKQSQLEHLQRQRLHEENLRLASQMVSQLKLEASALRKLEFRKRKLVVLAEDLHRWALKCTGNVDPRSPQFSKRKIFFKLDCDVLVLHRLINKFQAKVNCLGSSNNGLQIFMEYKKLVKEVAALTRKIQKKEENLSAYQTRVDEIKAHWLEEVNRLIEKINHNFQKFFAAMNCAGEVSLYRGEDENDFSQYGIHIKVKFREESNLQILNAQTQSGGERAVSVAIYLLSLQELTTVPFRCIDEINQGMDADNERRIFNLITKATEERCQTQYFLLTPKLLPKLHFTPHMKVFCPYNGIGSLPHDKVSQKIDIRYSM